MYIFYGKLNWSSDPYIGHRKYAGAEPFVLMFPADLSYFDPVCAYWQWTTDKDGNKKVNNWKQDFITSISKERDGSLRLGFVFTDHIHYTYNVIAVVAQNVQTVEVTMTNAANDEVSTDILRQSFWSKSKIASAAVYTGKFNYLNYAKDEMLTVVIPYGFEAGKPVRVYFQWTETAKPSSIKNANNKIEGSFDTSTPSTDGSVAITFKSDDRAYDWKGTVQGDMSSLTLYMKSTKGGDWSSPYKLQRSGWCAAGRRKALIVRYGVGTDRGIFDIRDLLINTLGFDSNCVEMLYYNSEPKGQPATCDDGQQAPTASRFKERFLSLIKDAVANDVRFLYVDTHESPRDDPTSGEKDKRDEGWKLALGEDGLLAEAVHDDWLSKDAIQKYLAVGVNLTILTSSCMGGGMLDTHKGTRGVLLAACHETQTNVKALGGKDPWATGIQRVMKGHKKNGRGMPTYAQLYMQAKLFIATQMSAGQMTSPGYQTSSGKSPKYLGPSPDPTNPLPYDDSGINIISHQDAQLVFCEDYMDVNVVRFLSPLSEWQPLVAKMNPGDTIRFPNDEL